MSAHLIMTRERSNPGARPTARNHRDARQVRGTSWHGSVRSPAPQVLLGGSRQLREDRHMQLTPASTSTFVALAASVILVVREDRKLFPGMAVLASGLEALLA